MAVKGDISIEEEDEVKVTNNTINLFRITVFADLKMYHCFQRDFSNDYS